MECKSLQIALALTAGFFSSNLLANEKNHKTNEVQNMNYKVEIENVSAQPALVIKGKAKVENVGDAIGAILTKVEKYLAEKKTNPAGAPFTRTYSFENGVLEFESGFPTSSKRPTRGDIIGTELPKGVVATTVHIGSQETSQNAYEAIHAWMQKNGKKEAGAPWEVYLTDPSSTPAEKSKTQVYFPVK